MANRVVFGTNSDPGMQVVDCGKELSFNNSDDWAGDSETGFGASVIIELDRKKVEKLRDALTTWLETP